MIKIITALGNPILNNELRKYSDFEVIGKDIQYMDGIIELLEINPNINYLILSEFLDGQTDLTDLIDKIIKINRKIKIIIILNDKNTEIEEKLAQKGIYDILYDKTDIIEIVNLLKTKNIEYLNKELREEINKLKELILKKDNNKIIKKYKNKLIKKNHNKLKDKNKKCKIIGITGCRGIGKTTFTIIFSEILKKNNKILIVDFDLINSNIKNIYKKNNYSENIKKLNIENDIKNNIIKLKNNISILTGLDLLYCSNKLDIKNIFLELKKLKSEFDYILIDTYSELLFKENKIILNECDSILFLTGLNSLEIQKSKKNINIMNKKWDINNKKINLILYKCKNIDFLYFNKNKLKNIFKEINIIGKIKYSHFIDLYLNNNFQNKLININITKDCFFIKKRINTQE